MGASSAAWRAGPRRPTPIAIPIASIAAAPAASAADWLRRVRNNADDLISLAREGARRPTRRVLARAEIRRQTREAGRSVLALLAEAEAGLARRADAEASICRDVA
jgi:cell division septum initiation protein DivIVA